MLRVLICLPTKLAAGVADEAAARAGQRRSRGARQPAQPPRAIGWRSSIPSPGPGRSLHLDATSVVVDDAWALTGGTHLWRRGLSFDASLAVAVFDERLTNGRPADVVAFRRALIAGRLGLAPTLLPEDPTELVAAVRQLSSRGGGLRLSPDPIAVPDPVPSDLDVTVWNPDGSPIDLRRDGVARRPRRRSPGRTEGRGPRFALGIRVDRPLAPVLRLRPRGQHQAQYPTELIAVVC